MRFCTSCGHELGIGRFCTNCGHRIDRSDARHPSPGAPKGSDPPVPPDPPDPPDVAATAERRAARREAALEPMPPRVPPSAAGTPPAPRYPLYADEVGHDLTTTTGAQRRDPGRPDRPADAGEGASLLDRLTSPPDHGASEHVAGGGTAQAWSEPHPHDEDGTEEGARRRPLLVLVPAVVAVVLALVVAAVLGWRALGDDSGGTGRDDTGAAAGAAAETRDVTADATVTVPGTAPAATEVGGRRVSFEAAHLLDGDPGTAWRVAGSAQGEEIVLSLAGPTTISQVGLVNGYAKRATDADGRRFDWYHGNRRVTAVTWVLDDGTEVDQDLTKDRQLQLTEIDPVTTDTVTLRLRAVSEPGRGRAGRDFTAISDIALIGSPVS